MSQPNASGNPSGAARASPTDIAAINTFLARGRAALQSRRDPVSVSPMKNSLGVDAPSMPIIGVMGNESGDMDSVVGSLYLAMALDRKLLSIGVGPTVSAEESVFVPLINFAADDLALRGDVFTALKPLDEPAFVSVADRPDVFGMLDALVLFDFNKLKGEQLMHEDMIVAIVDHHKDEGAAPHAKPREITVCGSACSLLFKLCGSPSAVCDGLPAARDLLLAPIVLDTQNFDKTLGKTTELDLVAAASLLGLPVPQSREDEAGIAVLQGACTTMFNELNAAKNDVSGLTIPQNLRRDYKAFAMPTPVEGQTLAVGIAAWLEPFDVVVRRHGIEDFVQGCLRYAAAAKPDPLDVVIVMFQFGEKEGLTRQAFWAVSSEGPRSTEAKAIARRFFHDLAASCEDAKGPRFASEDDLSALLTPQTILSGDCCGVVRQRNVAISRKTLTPIMQAEFAKAAA